MAGIAPDRSQFSLKTCLILVVALIALFAFMSCNLFVRQELVLSANPKATRSINLTDTYGVHAALGGRTVTIVGDPINLEDNGYIYTCRDGQVTARIKQVNQGEANQQLVNECDNIVTIRFCKYNSWLYLIMHC